VQRANEQVVLGDDGRKLSKRLMNFPEPAAFVF